MVEQKELVTLFQIKKIDEESEALIPFVVIDGIYNDDNHTFMTSDGVVYKHIEETEIGNIGYAKRIIKNIDLSTAHGAFGSLEFESERKFNTDNVYKYFRFNKEPNTIYVKGNFNKGIQIMNDKDSKKYQQENIENISKTQESYQKANELNNGYLGIKKTPEENSK